MAVIGSVVTLVVLAMTPHTPENMFKRLGMFIFEYILLFNVIGLLCGFGFFSGTSLGPLLDAVIKIEPRLVL